MLISSSMAGSDELIMIVIIVLLILWIPFILIRSSSLKDRQPTTLKNLIYLIYCRFDAHEKTRVNLITIRHMEPKGIILRLHMLAYKLSISDSTCFQTLLFHDIEFNVRFGR